MKKFLLIFFCSLSLWAETKPKVLVTVPPYHYLVEKIAGPTVEIQLVIPPGVNAHLYEPVPKDLEKMAQASLWFKLGDPVENKLLLTLKEKNPSLVTVELCHGIALLGHDHCCDEGKDFHFWLSPKLAEQQAKKIADHLTKLYPEHEKLYRENLHLLLAELAALDQKIAHLLAPLKGKALLVSHPAFGYFCQDYGLVQISIEFEGKEPRPKQIAQILKQIETVSVKAVLTQAQYSNKGAEMIAEKLQMPVFLVDPYSMDYSKNLLYIAELIAR